MVTTHVKDGGLFLTEGGLVSFPAEAGTGVVDLHAIFEKLSAGPRTINLSLEDHGGEFLIPIHEGGFLAGFPDLTSLELAKLLGLAARSQSLKDRQKLAILDRARWPEVCERRVKHGLRAVRRIVSERTG